MAFRINFKRLLTLAIVINLTLWVSSEAVGSEEAGKVPWQIIVTQYTIIKYHTPKDISKFERSIDFSASEGGFKSLFSSSGSKNPASSIAEKIDAMYLRVQEILDMKKRMDRIVIKVYSKK